MHDSERVTQVKAVSAALLLARPLVTGDGKTRPRRFMPRRPVTRSHRR